MQLLWTTRKSKCKSFKLAGWPSLAAGFADQSALLGAVAKLKSQELITPSHYDQLIDTLSDGRCSTVR